MKYALLNTLLPQLEAFERTYPGEQNPQRFAAWLLAQQADGDTATTLSESNKLAEESSIVQSVLFLSRYLRIYGRKVLEDSILGNADEYVYLLLLQQSGSISKTELISRNRHEKPTGMEIIRRLSDLGLIQQSDDLYDRRSKKLSLTEEGVSALVSSTEAMQKIFRLMVGNLTPVERVQFLQILEKLERFHQVIQARMKEGERRK